MNQILKSVYSILRSNPQGVTLFLLFFFAIIILIQLNLSTQVGDNWDNFIIEHQCKEIRKEGSNNLRRTWVCNDGEKYYRWRQQM